MRRSVLALAMVVVGSMAVASGLRAQDAPGTQAPPSLDRADELARLGRADEARQVLSAWWSDGYAKANRRDVQRALWLRGRLTVDPAQAALDYQRLVIEYPGGPFSDQALFRLAQGAFAAGDSARAAQDVARLGQEYPGSPVRRDAEAWLAAAGSPPPPSPVQGADSTAAPEAPPPAETEPAPSGSTGRYAVQLGAFSSGSRARALQRRIQDAGFDARLARVPGSDLVRVRVGRFDAQGEAEAILGRLRDLGFTATLVLDANREEGVGHEEASR